MDFSDVLLVTGLGLLVAAAAFVSTPAALLAGGAVCICLCVVLDMRGDDS